jgi:hypothetical protein
MECNVILGNLEMNHLYFTLLGMQCNWPLHQYIYRSLIVVLYNIGKIIKLISDTWHNHVNLQLMMLTVA